MDENLNVDFGECPVCGGKLVPSYFQENELDAKGFPTGRWRRGVSSVSCCKCLRPVVTDGEYGSGPWHNK